MNYSTSFLDLCSCALGGLLLLMFLLVPQTKPKALDTGGVKPSLAVECHYPVYTNDFDKSNNRNTSLPFGIVSIDKVVIALSNGQKMEFYNKTDRKQPLWTLVVPPTSTQPPQTAPANQAPQPTQTASANQASQPTQAPQPILQKLDDGTEWTLTFAYRSTFNQNLGDAIVRANIELRNGDFSELQAIMIVHLTKKLMYTNLKTNQTSLNKKDLYAYVYNNELIIDNNKPNDYQKPPYTLQVRDPKYYYSASSFFSSETSMSGITKKTCNGFGFFKSGIANDALPLFSRSELDGKNPYSLCLIKDYSAKIPNSFRKHLLLKNEKGDIFSNISINYIKLKTKSNDKIDIDHYYYMPLNPDFQ